MEQALKSLISWWDVSGVDVPDIPVQSKRKPRPKIPLSNSTAESPRQSQATPVPEKPAPPAALELLKKVATLDDLKKVIQDFDAGEISDHARQAVFARGNPEADIMVIGEIPTRDEDIQGKPFVGKSGQFIDKVFGSIGLDQDTLYMTHVVNWCPPGGRNPSPDEIAKCLPFIQKHIELIKPKIIVLVGGISFSALTGRTGMMKNRGQWTSISIAGTEIPALPIYDPDILMRQPDLKKDSWMDMLSLREEIETVNTSS